MIRSIADLFTPHDPTMLDAAMLGGDRLHLKTGRAAAFAELLSWEVFNTLPNAERLLDGEMRVTNLGRDVPFDLAVPRTKHRNERPLRADALHGMAEQGMSVILNQIERRVPPIAALCAMLERHYRAKVVANCYAGFRRGSAFPPHFDDHNVLVLQLHGSKRWSCYGQPYHAPVADPRFALPDEIGPPEAEILMEPGDLLYLPRGEVHSATVIGRSSMHLSLTIRPPRGRNLLRWVAEQAETECAAREDIPWIEGIEARAARQERLRAALHRLADTLDLDAFQLAMDRLRQPEQPFNLGLADSVPPDTLVLASLRRRVPLPDSGKLALPSRTVTLLPDERAVLALLLERDGLTVSDLAGLLPNRSLAAVQQAIAGLARHALIFLFPSQTAF